MKRIYTNYKIIIILGFLVSCNRNNKNPHFQEIKLTENTVVGIWPDSIEIETLKNEFGEDDFYTVADDIMWYNAKMLEKLDSLDIAYISTDSHLVRILTPKDQLEINKDTMQNKWSYFYYDGNTTTQKDVYDLIRFSINT